MANCARVFLTVGLVLGALAPAGAGEIAHRMLMVDESRHALRYVDETAPALNWELPIGPGFHDVQLIGSNQAMVSSSWGYSVYDLATRKLVREVKPPGVTSVYSARRKADGTVLLGANDKQGVVIFELDGNYLVSGGFAATFYEFKPDGSVVSQWQAHMPEGLENHFYGGFRVLKNGHVVVANWTGHGEQDGKKGWQLIEFDRAGNVVWKWHDAKLAGSLNSVVAVDDADWTKFQDDGQ